MTHQDNITSQATMGDKYRAIYMTLWRMDRRHYRVRTFPAANDGALLELTEP